MIYQNAQDWRGAAQKNILLFGMSGLGKTFLANMLRSEASWFHYSVDYRIGTRYMGEHIADNVMREAMRVPLLRELLRSDSVSIQSKITFDNLSPLSTYLGKPGNPERGGLPLNEYRKRQSQHMQAEVQALLDTPHFIERAQSLYGYDNFVCDTGGSICEVVDPTDPNDPILTSLSKSLLLVWIEGSEAHIDTLERRFDKAPKPMCYQPEFLLRCWTEYLNDNSMKEGDVDPDDFVRWTYRRALDHRQPRYAMMAKNWGIKVRADDVAAVHDAAGFDDLIAAALEDQG